METRSPETLSSTSSALPFAHVPELMRAVMEAAPVAMFEIDADGIILFSSGTPLQFIEGRPLSTVGRSVFELYAHVPGVCAMVRRALAGEAFTDTAAVPGIAGEERVFQTTYTPVADDQGRVIRVIGVAADITPRTKALDELARSNDALRALTARIQAQREEDRARISREVHDVIGQALTAFTFDLGWLRRRTDPERDTQTLERLSEMDDRLNALLARTQSITADLRPPELDSGGLCLALRSTAARFTKRFEIECEVTCSAPDALLGTLPLSVSVSAYRIAQEALTNVARHAHARHVWITISLMSRGRERPALHVEVADDGIGMSSGVSDGDGEPPLGILGMYGRAVECGGSLAVEARPGGGTVIATVFPLTTPRS